MRKNLWMLAAILICGAMTMLTGCSDKDNPVDNNNTPTGKKLTGMYTVVLDDENGTIGANAYSMVLVAYDFKADGTGLWSELYYNDEDVYPFIGNGGEVGGQFKYTVDDEGNVSFTFDRPEFAPQRGTVISVDEDLIALHHTIKDIYYFGLLEDEETANDIRTLMTQFNGGRDKWFFSPGELYAWYHEKDKLTLVDLETHAPVVDATINLEKKSDGYYMQMNGATITLDNITGIYTDSAQPLINGMDRDLTIILKGTSVIRVTNPLGIQTSGNIKLGGSGVLKIITNAEGANHFGIQGANYGKDKDALNDLAYDNAVIKRIDKVVNKDGTCTWSYVVGDHVSLVEVTKEDIGKPVSADGYVYPCLDDLNADGGTLAGMLACVTEKGHGLILSSKAFEYSFSYENAKDKAASITPAIAGCEPWHLVTDVEVAEMLYACAGVASKPIVYEDAAFGGLEFVAAKIGCDETKFTEKAVKAGIGNVVNMVVDLNGKRAWSCSNLITRCDVDDSVYNKFPVRACAKF